ncbi:family 8 carbohydrate esterase [Lasiosphaeria miniovina]|uniref:pectinesterase n=1 Tax=Lasiosphaeria miniovina TaxID=1954250 RepID=A0AA40DRU2_9PEZI|nr:family 8 carbohydrate esterase [Lasiosphaeria miniovina]KAK0709653.1 family 8 carbohydrate esterase [Lasiosphaeria miniovina]
MRRIVAILPLFAPVLAANRTVAPPGCITVSNTIQAAVDALSTASADAQCIFISPGTYTEQVLVPARRAQLSVYGSTADTGGYAGNEVTITSSKSQADGLSNDGSATLRVKAAGFRLYNVNINNGHGRGSQAVALSASADSAYYGCAFTGYQDTLLADTGTQLYARCLVQGVTDFIFGQHAPAWFEKCDIRVLSASMGYITASGRSSSSDPNYYVFNSCSIAAAAGSNVADGAFYLGRPWRAYARVVMQKTSMTSVVNPAGWRIWNAGDERTSNVLFGEHANTGAGAKGTRAPFATKFSSAVAIETVLGSGFTGAGWFDSAYL